MHGVGDETMGIWCEERRSWISEIGRKLVEKQAKRNKKAIWYKGLVSQSTKGMLLTSEQP